MGCGTEGAFDKSTAIISIHVDIVIFKLPPPTGLGGVVPKALCSQIGGETKGRQALIPHSFKKNKDSL